MDNQDSQILDENSESRKFDNYIQLALDICEQHTRSRGGFGAFQKFRDICLNSMGMVFESGFFANSNHQTPFQFLNDEFFHEFYMRKGKFRLNFRYFFEQILSNPASYSPNCLWSLFWALAKAEHEFLLRYTPYWSHEERLTGHLVSQIITRLEDFEVYWAALDDENETEDKSHCRIHYMDTATARRESLTGADLGLIIQARFSRQQEFFKAVRFQAKKVDKSGNARIDLNQTDALIRTKSLGYYLFYHRYDLQNWSPAPTVQPASNFEYHVEESRKNENKLSLSNDIKLGEKTLGVTSGGYDFATFITFALADQASEHGVLAASAKEATSLLMSSNRNLPQLSRIVAVTLGSQASEIDWDRLFEEYLDHGDLQ